MFTSILQYEFLQNAFLAGILIGFIAPLLGVFVVVRRLALIADALSHIALAGIAFGLLVESKLYIHVNPLYSGTLFSVFGSMFIEKLRNIYKHFQELAIPIILSTGIGLSVIFISLADGFTPNILNYLFGSINAVSRSDVTLILFISIFVLLLIIGFYKELFLLSFDEEHARVTGINEKFLRFLFIVLVALVIAASMRIVGTLLVSSLMTLPVAAGIRLAKSFKQAIVFSVILGELAVFGGLIIAFYLNLAPGGVIVLLSVLWLIIAIYWQKFIATK